MTRPALLLEYPLTRDLEQGLRRVPTAIPGAARQWIDDVLRPHGLGAIDGPESGRVAWSTNPTPSGWVLVVSPVVERTADEVGGANLLPLPDGTRLEELGWEVEGDAWNRPADGEPDEPDEPDRRAVAGDKMPSVARALVNAWWSETATAGAVRRPPAPDVESARGGWVRYDAALEYADALERTASDLRNAVERALVEDATRRGDYTAALRALADRMSGEAAAATDLAADIIGSGRGRLAPGHEVGLPDAEGWVLTAVLPTE